MSVRISDPIGALVRWFRPQPDDGATWTADDRLINSSGGCEYVTSPLLTSKALTLQAQLPPALAFKGAGIGTGSGHDEQAPYASIRVDCMAYGKTDFDAWRLSLLATRDILAARQQRVKYWHDAIEYVTRFITIVQSGGPVPLRDEHTDWPAVLTVFHIEASTAS